MFRFILIICVMAFLTTTQVLAQELEDVVYLKNGGIVRGTVIFEQLPDKSLKIARFDGRVFRYKMNEIDKMSKETVIGTRSVAKKKNPMVALGLSFPIIGAGTILQRSIYKGSNPTRRHNSRFGIYTEC